MTGEDTPPFRLRTTLSDPDATEALGVELSRGLGPGDVLLLSGPIGAGKSHLARALIAEMMDRNGGGREDIPSPTYTLVQTYSVGDVEIWHADLYRLSGSDEISELGLDLAFNEAVCIVEWPDRLGEYTPDDALTIRLEDQTDGPGRLVMIESNAPRWARTLEEVGQIFGSDL